MSVKSIARKYLPNYLWQAVTRAKIRLLGVDREFRGMSVQEVFERIYADGVWGQDSEGAGTSGLGSHHEDITCKYTQAVEDWLSSLPGDVRKNTACDLGCGDFNVGLRLYAKFDRYFAFDVSRNVIERNKSRYGELGVDFQVLNIAEEHLPEADVYFVRQVLQHLDNDTIDKFVKNIGSVKSGAHLVVTEHLPEGCSFTPNLNKPIGANVRIVNNSGVVLHEEPFGISTSSKQEILRVDSSDGGGDGVIVTTVYRL